MIEAPNRHDIDSLTTRLLLPTKLAPPTPRQRLVHRRRLVERLEAAPPGALTLIAAPAGFGKTSLLGEWCGASRGAAATAWVSLDERDNDPSRFWSYVVAALQAERPGLGADVLRLLRDRQPVSPEALLAGLVRDLTEISGRITLVLDDYHVIEMSAIHAAVGFLVDHAPATLRLVISTRADPPFPLARLRARGQLVEVRTSDLRLTAGEAATFLADTMGVSLSSEATAMLIGRSEGWPAGLQLAALATQGREDPDAFVQAFAGSHRFVLDYLVAEVLSRLSVPVQTFLLRTAVLDRLCGPLCDALLADRPVETSPGTTEGGDPGVSESQAILEELERANLFLVPLDDERRWYRYHHLFGEALRHCLRQASPDLIPELHRRASDWYAGTGLSAEAVEHALLARDWERAVRLIRPLSRPLFEQGLHTTLQRWLVSLPEDVRRAFPSFNFGHGLSLLLLGQIQQLERLLDTAEAELGTRDVPRALGEVYVLRASLAASRLEGTTAAGLAEAALDLLAIDDPEAPRANALLILGQARSLCGILDDAEQALAEGLKLCAQQQRHVARWMGLNLVGTLELLRGRLRRAAARYQEALTQAGDRPVFPRVGSLAHLGAVFREWGQLDVAAAYLRDAIELGERVGLGVYLGSHLVEQARLYGACGEHQQAAAALDAAEQAARRLGSTALVRQVRAHRARLQLVQGDLAGAVRWADTEAADLTDVATFGRLSEALTLARVRISQGEPATVAPLVTRCLAATEQAGAGGWVVEILVVLALLHARSGDQAAALEALERALRLAQPEGYVRLFVDEGEPLAALLRQLRPRPDLAGYSGRLLQAFGTSNARRTPASPASLLPEPPSERELEVLRLLADGLSNRQIAERLIIAESTVKAHLHHLGGKLGSRSRTQILARSRELGLL